MGSQHRVFIVDDDQAVAESLRFSLEADGYNVAVFPDAITLLSETKNPAWDCLIVDQNMPGITGLQLLEWLAGRGDALDAVLLASHPNAAERARAAAAGVEIVETPWAADALDLAIRNVIARRCANSAA